MSEGPAIKELSAEELISNWHDFLEWDLATQEKELLPLAQAVISASASPEILDRIITPDIDPKFNEIFSQAIEAVFSSPVELGPDETPGHIWGRTGAFIAVDTKTLKPVAQWYQLNPDLESYGDLRAYALEKALAAIHVYRENYKNRSLSDLPIIDLQNKDVWRYLEKLGFAHPSEYPPDAFPTDKVMLWFGSASDTVTHKSRNILISSSGATLTGDYLKRLLGGAQPAPDTKSGLIDWVACDEVSRVIRNTLLGEPSTRRLEPARFKQQRLQN